MTLAVKIPHVMTAGEFMDWPGDGHVGRQELVNGEIRSMDPPAPTHGFLQARLAYLLTRHIKSNKLPCLIATEAGVQPRFQAKINVRVPDVVVTCLPFLRGAKLITEPVLIIEILSPSNEKATWDSIHAMSTIPALAEIAVFRSNAREAQVFQRGADGAWPIESPVIGWGGHLRFESLNYEVPLDEVYEDIELTGDETE